MCRNYMKVVRGKKIKKQISKFAHPEVQPVARYRSPVTI